jgi:hypothetical protein
MATSALRSPGSLPSGSDEERSLLTRLEGMLDREEGLLAERDADGLAALADEREYVVACLGTAARARTAATIPGSLEDRALVAAYRRLRDLYEIRAQVVRRHADQNARAIGVLAQATGQSNLYRADGRVPLRFVSA